MFKIQSSSYIYSNIFIVKIRATVSNLLSAYRLRYESQQAIWLQSNNNVDLFFVYSELELTVCLSIDRVKNITIYLGTMINIESNSYTSMWLFILFCCISLNAKICDDNNFYLKCKAMSQGHHELFASTCHGLFSYDYFIHVISYRNMQRTESVVYGMHDHYEYVNWLNGRIKTTTTTIRTTNNDNNKANDSTASHSH